MRDHVINELVHYFERDDNAFLITGDLGYKVLDEVKDRFNNRFLNVGIAEQNMTSIAAGLAKEGNCVFTYSIGNFSTLRCIEQIRNDICYPKLHVVILAVGSGFAYGNQGVTHHATEDLSILRSLPNMMVFSPGDPCEAVEAFHSAINYSGPSIIRLARNKDLSFHENPVSNILHLQKFYEAGNDITILTTGTALKEGQKLYHMLTNERLDVGLYSVPTIKPIDKESIVSIARKSKIIVTIEEHNIIGGIGSAVAEIVAELFGLRSKLIRFGLDDVFSSAVGDEDYLLDYYGISAKRVFDKINECFKGDI